MPLSPTVPLPLLPALALSLLPNYNSLPRWLTKQIEPAAPASFCAQLKTQQVFKNWRELLVCTHILTGSSEEKSSEGEGDLQGVLSTPLDSAGRRLFCQFEKR